MSIFNTIWSSIPFIHAMFTVVFFVLIRVYTRSPCKSGMKDKDTDDKKNRVIDKVSNKAKETVDEVKGMLEGMSDVADCELDVKCDSIDAQTYGEIFAGAFLAGCVVRLGWGS